MAPRFHTLSDGRRIAFRHWPGEGPAAVFLPGYMSDMAGGKATALTAWAQTHGRECLLLDYSGCGESPGSFADGTLSRWAEEVLALVESRLAGPVVLVGSSMGGWLMLLVGRALGARLAGLVGVAAAPDFTDWGFTDEQKATLERDGRLSRGEQLTTLAFWQTGEALKLLGSEMAIDCPVRLVHGERDEDVPSSVPAILMGRLRSADVQLKLIKNGGHRLSEPHEIAAVLNTVAELLEPK